MNEKILALVQALTNQTRARKVRWQVMSDEMYRARVGRGMVRVVREYEPFEDVPKENEPKREYRLLIMDDIGQLATQVTVLEGKPGSEALEELFQAAREAATDYGKLVDDMLLALNSGKP